MQDNPFPQQHNPFQSPLESGYIPAAEQYGNVQYAGFWIRLGAYIIDAILLWLITIIPIFMLHLLIGGDAGEILGSIFSFVVSLAYIIGFWISSGATPGKKVLNLRIVNAETGGKLTPLEAVLRYVGYLISSFLCFLGFIWIAFESRKRGFHDMIAKTVVVKVTPSGAPRR